MVEIPKNEFEDPEVPPAPSWVVALIWLALLGLCVVIWAAAIYGGMRFVKG